MNDKTTRPEKRIMPSGVLSWRLLRLWWMLPLCFYGMELSHESGHLAAGWLTGAAGMQLEWLPWSFTRTAFAVNPHPLAVVWSGPLAGILLPLALWRLGKNRRGEPRLRFFAGLCLLANGVYIGLGSFDRTGDCLEMAAAGTPSWVMLSFGLLAGSAGLWLWHGLKRAAPPSAAA